VCVLYTLPPPHNPRATARTCAGPCPSAAGQTKDYFHRSATAIAVSLYIVVQYIYVVSYSFSFFLFPFLLLFFFLFSCSLLFFSLYNNISTRRPKSVKDYPCLTLSLFHSLHRRPYSPAAFTYIYIYIYVGMYECARVCKTSK